MKEHKTIREIEQGAYEKMKAQFGYKNALSAPRLVKVVLSVGTGKAVKNDKNRNDLVVDRLTKITGQKPAIRKAKKAIATFKTRQGDVIGVMVTLRGVRMYNFLEKLLNVSLPRTKDFRGINTTGVDEHGNMTFGIKEHTIFPEIKDEELKDVFSLAVTVVTTAGSKEEAHEFFKILKVPFIK